MSLEVIDGGQAEWMSITAHAHPSAAVDQRGNRFALQQSWLYRDDEGQGWLFGTDSYIAVRLRVENVPDDLEQEVGIPPDALRELDGASQFRIVEGQNRRGEKVDAGWVQVGLKNDAYASFPINQNVVFKSDKYQSAKGLAASLFDEPPTRNAIETITIDVWLLERVKAALGASTALRKGLEMTFRGEFLPVRIQAETGDALVMPMRNRR